MFDARRKSTGIKHTTTTTLLIVFIFSLTAWIAARPFGSMFSLLVVAGSVPFLTAAWLKEKTSPLCIADFWPAKRSWEMARSVAR